MTHDVRRVEASCARVCVRCRRADIEIRLWSTVGGSINVMIVRSTEGDDRDGVGGQEGVSEVVLRPTLYFHPLPLS